MLYAVCCPKGLPDRCVCNAHEQCDLMHAVGKRDTSWNTTHTLKYRLAVCALISDLIGQLIVGWDIMTMYISQV
jgi:hypothetical protein